ncbi:MAG: hypothetical protein MZV70_08905 [Desulfobacterales bacterium]|nr:hypothetical protein [Desulfobacterales bacterium]
MSVRRNIFVAMITSRHRTMDNMTAFMKSVNHDHQLEEHRGLRQDHEPRAHRPPGLLPDLPRKAQGDRPGLIPT